MAYDKTQNPLLRQGNRLSRSQLISQNHIIPCGREQIRTFSLNFPEVFEQLSQDILNICGAFPEIRIVQALQHLNRSARHFPQYLFGAGVSFLQALLNFSDKGRVTEQKLMGDKNLRDIFSLFSPDFSFQIRQVFFRTADGPLQAGYFFVR